jgi:hypothetical protein
MVKTVPLFVCDNRKLDSTKCISCVCNGVHFKEVSACDCPDFVCSKYQKSMRMVSLELALDSPSLLIGTSSVFIWSDYYKEWVTREDYGLTKLVNEAGIFGIEEAFFATRGSEPVMKYYFCSIASNQ